jgi:hypothetical protein
MRAIARQRIEREHDSEFAQRLAGAPRQVEASWVGAIDDVDVVVTRRPTPMPRAVAPSASSVGSMVSLAASSLIAAVQPIRMGNAGQ